MLCFILFGSVLFAEASDETILFTAFDDVCYAGGANGRYDDFVLFADELLAVKYEGKWGYIDPGGKIILPFQYDEAAPFEDGIACVAIGEKKLVIDTSGKELCDVSTYDSVENGGNKTIIVKKDGLFGVISASGSVRVEPVWESLTSAAEGYHVVSQNGKYGYISKNGKVMIKPQYAYAHPFSDDAAYVETADGQHLLIDTDGNILLEDAYSGVTEGLVIIQKEGLWGFADKNGEVLVECEWDDVEVPSESLAAVCKDGLWGFVDYSGTVVIEPQWPFIWGFSNDMAVTAEISDETGITDRYGFINKIGITVKEPQYGNLLPFTQGCAAFMDAQTQLWGYVDQTGTIMIDPAYDEAMPFSSGYALVRVGTKYSLVDQKGTVLMITNGELPSVDETPDPEKKPNPEEKTNSEPIDFMTILSLIASIALILFLLLSLVRQLGQLTKRKPARQPVKTAVQDPYTEVSYEEENFFGSVKNMNAAMQQTETDYDDFDINEYYDDLNGDSEESDENEK